MIYNELQTARVENFLKRLLGIRNGGIVPSLGPELGASLEFPTNVDTDAIAGYIRFGFGMARGASVGNYSVIVISNVTSSQLFGVKLTSTSQTAVGHWLCMVDAAVAPGSLIAADQCNWLDTRRTHLSLPLNANGIQIGSSVLAAGPAGYGISANAVGVAHVAASTPMSWPWVVLRPSTSVLVGIGTVNIDLFASGECWLRDINSEELII